MKQVYKANLGTAKTTPAQVKIRWEASTRDLVVEVNGLAQDEPETILHELAEIGAKASEILGTL